MVGGELNARLARADLRRGVGLLPGARCRRWPTAACSSSTTSAASSASRASCSTAGSCPLESRVDFLTLKSGQKFELPFVLLMVFATNIRPADLVDEAFLRRIHYKVFAESPTVEDFVQIFQNCCAERGIDFDRSLVEACSPTTTGRAAVALRGCHPRDLIEQALSLAQYRGLPRQLDRRAAAARLRKLLRGRPRADNHDSVIRAKE